MIDVFKSDRKIDWDTLKSRDQIVAQSNDLIRKAKYDLSSKELKIMDYLISKIKPDDLKFNVIQTSLYEMSNIFNLSRSGKVYNDLTKSFRSLRAKEVIIKNEETDSVTVTGWLTEFRVTRTGIVTAKISSDLAPYLLRLKESGYYTQHLLNDTIKLNSKYSIRLYKLVREANKNRGKTTPEIALSPDEFQELMSSPSSYSTGQFKQNVLDKAIDEINKEILDMDLSISSVKEGRRIQRFIVKNNHYPIKI